MATSQQAAALKPQALAFSETEDLGRLMAPLIDDSSLVLIGEASHGTHEFYQARADITQYLIEQKGFNSVVIEGDWPDTFRVNRFVKGYDTNRTALESLSGFKRFPIWMWRNQETLEFISWLHRHNQNRPLEQRTGFYGMDLYSLYSSIVEVIQYLAKIDPEGAEKAKEFYNCFDSQYVDASQYGYGVKLGIHEDCQEQALRQLVELRNRSLEAFEGQNLNEMEAQFCAEENARVVVNAESYYRGMFSSRVNTWNIRDQHMAETIANLRSFQLRQGQEPKTVVWAHNSHLGDARATERSDADEVNLGQLLRERYDEQTKIIGMSTYSGTVIAASDWGAPWNLRMINKGLSSGLESLMHSVGSDRFLLDLKQPDVKEALKSPLLERAIGVIYRPETERWSHYFHANVAEQFDVLLHFDESQGLHPLDDRPRAEREIEPPETYPSGV